MEDGVVSQQYLGRVVAFMTLTGPGEHPHLLALPSTSSAPRVAVPSPRGACLCHEDYLRLGIAGLNVGLSACWNRLRLALAREYPGLDFFRSVEVQKRGVLHLHLMVATDRPMDPLVVQRLALRAGFGCHMDLSPLEDSDTDGARRHGAYLSKYVSKATDGRDSAPWERLDVETGELVSCRARYRTWSSSRGWGVRMATVMTAIRLSSRCAAVRLAADRVELPAGQTVLDLGVEPSAPD